MQSLITSINFDQKQAHAVYLNWNDQSNNSVYCDKHHASILNNQQHIFNVSHVCTAVCTKPHYFLFFIYYNKLKIHIDV